MIQETIVRYIGRIDNLVIRTYLNHMNEQVRRTPEEIVAARIKEDLEPLVNNMRDCGLKFELQDLITKL